MKEVRKEHSANNVCYLEATWLIYIGQGAALLIIRNSLRRSLGSHPGLYFLPIICSDDFCGEARRRSAAKFAGETSETRALACDNAGKDM